METITKPELILTDEDIEELVKLEWKYDQKWCDSETGSKSHYAKKGGVTITLTESGHQYQIEHYLYINDSVVYCKKTREIFNRVMDKHNRIEAERKKAFEEKEREETMLKIKLLKEELTK